MLLPCHTRCLRWNGDNLNLPNSANYVLTWSLYKGLCVTKFLKNMPSPASFRLCSSFQSNITIITKYKCEKMSIQYTVLGFKLMTFGTRVSSHNH